MTGEEVRGASSHGMLFGDQVQRRSVQQEGLLPVCGRGAQSTTVSVLLWQNIHNGIYLTESVFSKSCEIYRLASTEKLCDKT